MKNDNSINRKYGRNRRPDSKEQSGSAEFIDHGKYLEKSKGQLDRGETISVLFTGVGGQGIILTTTVLARAAILAGLDVKVSEVHGMAQRGGSVVGSVRFGKKVYSPIIDRADYIVSLEKLEAVRYLDMLKPEGFIFINDFEVYPVSIYLSGKDYPEDILSKISKITSHYKLIEATDIAVKLKEVRASNMVLIGSLSRFLPIGMDHWIEAIKKNVPERAVGINIDAFDRGREILK